jgi:PST family polysaccharide transporter
MGNDDDNFTGPSRNLGSSAARGAAVTMAGQVARVSIQLVGLVVLARLLSPSDYGLLTMVIAIIGVGEIFRDFGLSTAAVQARTLSKAQRSNLFWINSFIGLGLTLVVLALSYPIALFFDEPRLQPIAAVLSVNFLLNGIATQFKADLNRQMKFSRLALIEILAPLAGLIGGLIAALSGLGYWSLVIQQTVLPVVMLLLFIAATRWLPGRMQRGVPMRHFLKFGVGLLGVQLLNYASRNADSIVIGARLGPAQLGIYDRAFQLLVLPLNQINAPATKVALPVLSKLQDDSVRYAKFILRGQSVLVHLITLIFALAIAQANPLILILLGEKWQGSTVVFQVLAVGGVMQALSYACYWVFLSHGLIASNLRFALITRPVVVLAVVVGSNWGVVGVAAGYSLALFLIWPFGMWWISRASNAPAGRMFVNGLRALVAYAACGAASFLLTDWLEPTSPFVEVLLGIGGFFVTFLLIGAAWPQFRKDVVQIAQIRSIMKDKP